MTSFLGVKKVQNGCFLGVPKWLKSDTNPKMGHFGRISGFLGHFTRISGFSAPFFEEPRIPSPARKKVIFGHFSTSESQVENSFVIFSK